MKRDLMPGEELVRTEHQHWIVMVRPLALPVALLVLVLLLDGFNSLPADYRILATLGAVAILGLVLISSWLRWNSRTFTLTNHRVILETGFLSRASRVVALDRVQDIATDQSFMGRLLGYGTVEIDSAGAAGAEVLAALPHPKHFRDDVFAGAEQLRGAVSVPGQASP